VDENLGEDPCEEKIDTKLNLLGLETNSILSNDKIDNADEATIGSVLESEDTFEDANIKPDSSIKDTQYAVDNDLVNRVVKNGAKPISAARVTFADVSQLSDSSVEDTNSATKNDRNEAVAAEPISSTKVDFQDKSVEDSVGSSNSELGIQNQSKS
jgi:hypothetical protein